MALQKSKAKVPPIATSLIGLSIDAQVVTHRGWVCVGDLQVDDTVFDRNGRPTKVTLASDPYITKTYKISLSNGNTFLTSENHQHIIHRRTGKRLPNGKTNNVWVEEVVSTKHILEKGVMQKRQITYHTPKGEEAKWYIPLVTAAVAFKGMGCSIDPYTVGVILGDGAINDSPMPVISCHLDDVHELRRRIPYNMGEIYHDKRRYETTSFRIKEVGLITRHLLGQHSSHTKSIPQCLLFGTEQERIAVLQGLMDTDGTVTSTGHCTFTSASEALARGVFHLVASLGGFANIKRFENAYSGYWNVALNLQEICPFRLKRKVARWSPKQRYRAGQRVAIISIDPIQKRRATPVRCVSVRSRSKSILLEGMIVTRQYSGNSEIAKIFLPKA